MAEYSWKPDPNGPRVVGRLVTTADYGVADNIVTRLRDIGDELSEDYYGTVYEAAREIERLRAEINDSTKALSRNATALMRQVEENNRLRVAGDALAEFVNQHSVSIPCRCKYGNEGETDKCCEKCAAIIDWQEARRG